MLCSIHKKKLKVLRARVTGSHLRRMKSSHLCRNLSELVNGSETKRWIRASITPYPLPSQAHTHKSLFHCYVYSPTGYALIFFCVHSDPEFDFYIGIVCSHLVSWLRIPQSQPWRDSMPAVGNEWPLSPARTLREAALYMYWIVTKIAQLKDTGGENALSRTDVFFRFFFYHCFYDLVRRCHCRGGKALDVNSGNLGLNVNCYSSLFIFFFPEHNLRHVLGLGFSICKMRVWYSVRVIVPLCVCACLGVCVCKEMQVHFGWDKTFFNLEYF